MAPEDDILYTIRMIGYLKGNIIHQESKFVILDVGGVGYKVFTHTALLENQPTTSAEFWTYLAVRENALDLYGFHSQAELTFFELLLTVSGIGPKSAISIISTAPFGNLYQGIVTGDIVYLTKVCGIGKKNAEKIILELKDKMIESVAGATTYAQGDADTLEALLSLGYSERDAREALKKTTGSSTEEKLRSALKNRPQYSLTFPLHM